MKPRTNFILPVLLIFSLISSCHTMYFSNPLPVDSRNIYKIPREYRGVWFLESDSVIIGKRSVRFIYKDDICLAKSEADTSSRFLLRDNLIYSIDTETGLSLGYPYTLKGDTICFTKRTISEIPLSTITFLRKVNGGYIFNSIARVIDEETGDWYINGYLKKTSDKEFILTGINHQSITGIPGVDLIYQTEYDHYYNAAWTRKEMDALIKRGYFSDTIYDFRKTIYNVSYSDSFHMEISIPPDSIDEKKPVDSEED